MAGRSSAQLQDENAGIGLIFSQANKQSCAADLQELNV